MSAAESEWPVLLRDYEAAIADFERVSRALTSALTERSATGDFRALVVAEESARESVVLARMRLMNLWRESGAEHDHHRAGLLGEPSSAQPP
jgi:hypothetical protein